MASVRESKLRQEFIETFVKYRNAMDKRKQSVEFYKYVYYTLGMESLSHILEDERYVQAKDLKELRAKFNSLGKVKGNEGIEAQIGFRDYFLNKYREEIKHETLVNKNVIKGRV